MGTALIPGIVGEASGPLRLHGPGLEKLVRFGIRRERGRSATRPSGRPRRGEGRGGDVTGRGRQCRGLPAEASRRGLRNLGRGGKPTSCARPGGQGHGSSSAQSFSMILVVTENGKAPQKRARLSSPPPIRSSSGRWRSVKEVLGPAVGVRRVDLDHNIGCHPRKSAQGWGVLCLRLERPPSKLAGRKGSSMSGLSSFVSWGRLVLSQKNRVAAWILGSFMSC